ncbi:MAG: hypothetical protein HKN79_07585, partial [Flavobacteriales bacterium]|nr:hypothetical protein [Flavobacteriales bacterium]
MNGYKTRTAKEKRKDSPVRKSLIGLLNGTFLAKDRVLDHIPFLLFMVGVAVCYISYGYHAETTVKELYRLESQVKDYKAQDLTLKSDLEQVKQQSNVAVAIQALGLK